MSYLEGMIPNRGYDGSLSLDLWSRQASDMRAKEEFAPGYMVKCPGVSLCQLGQVMEIDTDERLAKVAWLSGEQGWWYLKDLVVVGMPVSQRMYLTHAERPLDEVPVHEFLSFAGSRNERSKVYS